MQKWASAQCKEKYIIRTTQTVMADEYVFNVTLLTKSTVALSLHFLYLIFWFVP